MLSLKTIYVPVALGDHIAYSPDVIFGTHQRAFILPLDSRRMFMHQNQDVFIELDPSAMRPRIITANDKGITYIVNDSRDMMPAVRGVHIVLKNYIAFRGTALASKSVRYARDILNTARELNRRSKKASVFLYDTLADMQQDRQSATTLVMLAQAVKGIGHDVFTNKTGLVAAAPVQDFERFNDYNTLIRILDVLDRPGSLVFLMDNNSAVFDMYLKLSARDRNDRVADLLATPAAEVAMFDLKTRHLHEEFRRLCLHHGVTSKRDVSDPMFRAKSEADEDY